MTKPLWCVNCVAEFPAQFCLFSMEGCAKTLGEEDTTEEDQAFFMELVSEPKEEKVFKDPISTGRKRAAVMYPLSPGQVCDWAWRKFCGGGIEPITGCTGRPAVHIHHGPDKSTFANERDNISLICNFCHNRWHTANDKYYIEPRPADNSEWLPRLNTEGRTIHRLDEMVKASKMEILTAEMLIPEGGKDGK